MLALGISSLYLVYYCVTECKAFEAESPQRAVGSEDLEQKARPRTR